MRKFIKFLIRLSNILNIMALKLQEVTLREYFYVYVPTRDKPNYIHKSFESARQEADRLSEKLDIDETIHVLQIVYTTTGENPPF